MTDFTEAFLSGVALAVVGFLGKEIASGIKERTNLRKILQVDARNTIKGLQDHEPSLKGIAKHLDDGEANFIWESKGLGPNPTFLADVPTHLSPQETNFALQFYDDKQKIDVIRDEFNLAIRNFITDSNNCREQHLKIAKACLVDMERQYKKACSSGANLIREVEERMYSDDSDL